MGKAFGGNYGKLSLFATAEGTQGITQGYTYLKSECNLDPNGLASMTKYNSKKSSSGDSVYNRYSNLCGHVGLAPGENAELYRQKIQELLVGSGAKPQYD